MDVVAVTICINYADFLAHALPKNRHLFSAHYIVTEESDKETIELAKTHNCKTLFTKDTHKNGAKFNRSGLLRAAQKIVHTNHPDSWVLILDADIICPPELSDLKLTDATAIYGTQRIMFETQEDYECNISKVGVVTTYIAGFFQLYFDKKYYYNQFSKDCSHYDIVFSDSFPKRIKLDSIKCIHLGFAGKNWNGRVTERWVNDK